MDRFETMGVKEQYIKGLESLNITVPTPVQSTVYAPILEGDDLVVQAMTGSGKTFAYLLPLMSKIDPLSKEIQVIVLVPTHELALQINQQIALLSKASGTGIRSQALIGGVKVARQVEALKEKPHIVVGSAGRMLEIYRLKKLKTHFVKTIVLDEGDKLLEDAYIEDINAVIKTTQKQRQLLLFSASISALSESRAVAIMNAPKIIKIDDNLLNPLVTHAYWVCDPRKKVENLKKFIAAVEPQRCLVFVNKNEIIQEVASKLAFHNYPVTFLFGNQTKADRAAAMHAFNSGKATIIITSELAARGLDIEGITHVVHLDVPLTADDYLHRIGRTGRKGLKGASVAIVSEKELSHLEQMVEGFGLTFIDLHVSHGEVHFE